MDVDRQNKLISQCHEGVTNNNGMLSASAARHFGRDKCYLLLSRNYSIPFLKERICMFTKYCETCQMNSTRKLHKCPHEMQPIKVSPKVWSQIGNLLELFYSNY